MPSSFGLHILFIQNTKGDRLFCAVGQITARNNAIHLKCYFPSFGPKTSFF